MLHAAERLIGVSADGWQRLLPQCRHVSLLIASDFFLHTDFCLCNLCSVSVLWYFLHDRAGLHSAISVPSIIPQCTWQGPSCFLANVNIRLLQPLFHDRCCVLYMPFSCKALSALDANFGWQVAAICFPGNVQTCTWQTAQLLPVVCQ